MEAEERGVAPLQDMHQQVQADPSAGKRQVFAPQSRKRSLLPIIPEYKDIWVVAAQLPANEHGIIKKWFPKGAKLLSRRLHKGFNRVVFAKERKMNRVEETLNEGSDFEVLRLGVPREPQQFLDEAVEKSSVASSAFFSGVDREC